MDEEKISREALEWVKKNRKQIIEKIASDDRYPSVDEPVSMFMAGSPGAGKTEVSKALKKFLELQKGSTPIVRIDPDEIRESIDGYIGGNAKLFQKAITKGVHFVVDHVLRKKNKNFILDGTLANLENARENIRSCLKRGREVVIIYVFAPPHVAWKFTQAREAEEGRSITREDFIDKFFLAKENVMILKEEFGADIQIWLVEKDFENNMKDFELNVDNIDSHLRFTYTREKLEDEL